MLLSVCYPLLSALLISSILLQQKDRLTRRWMRTVAWVWTESVWWTGSVFYEPVPDSRLTKGWVFAHAGLIVLGRSREKGAKLSVSSQHWLASGPVTVSDCVRVCVRGKWGHVSGHGVKAGGLISLRPSDLADAGSERTHLPKRHLSFNDRQL